MKFRLLALLIFLTSFIGISQISDLARIEYIGIPDKGDGLRYDRYRILLNYPIKVKEDAYFLIGADYSSINLEIDETLIPFNPNQIDRFQLFDFNLGYTYKINQDWRFGARLAPGISSNFGADKVTMDDVAFSADVVFIKDRKAVEAPEKPSRLIVGLSVSNNRGFPILPFVSYYRKFHPKWSYNIGVPKSNLQWHINSKHRFKAVVRLDGFGGNIQNGILINQELADRFRLRLLVSGLRYEFKFSKNFELYINGSYIINSNAVLREGVNTDILEINQKNATYLKTGIRLKV